MSFDIRDWDGRPISEPGIYRGIPMDAYHRQLTVGPSISSSGLRTIFHESPRAYFRTSYLNPQRKPEEPSKPFIFGRGAHHLLLGEENFRQHFAVRPETYPDVADEIPKAATFDPDFLSGWPAWPQKPWNATATVCKAWLFWAWWQGKTVLTPGDIRMIVAMAEALAEEPLVQAGILNGLIEHSFVWQDKATGVWLKWRPDNLPTDSLSFSDFKTCTSVADQDLERSISDFGYNMQGALGQLGCRATLDRDMESFSLVFVEKVDVMPCVRTKTLRPADISLGVRQIDVSLRMFRKCLDEGRWLGPGGEQHDNEYSGLTDFASKRALARIEEMERQLA